MLRLLLQRNVLTSVFPLLTNCIQIYNRSLYTIFHSVIKLLVRSLSRGMISTSLKRWSYGVLCNGDSALRYEKERKWKFGKDQLYTRFFYGECSFTFTSNIKIAWCWWVYGGFVRSPEILLNPATLCLRA